MNTLVAGLAWLAAGSAAAAPCGAQLDARWRRQVEADGVVLAYAPRPAPFPLGRHFRLEVAVCGAPATGLQVDADMPAHRHGMNYRSTVKALGHGRFRVEGMLFHMPGRWRLTFDVEAGGRVQRLAQEVDVE